MKERVYPFAIKAKVKDTDVLVFVEAGSNKEAERMVQKMYITQFNTNVEELKALRLNHLQEFYSSNRDYYIA